MNNKFFVTGSTGWVGKAFLNELQKNIPKEIFNEKVKCFSSKKRIFFSTHYKDPIKIESYPLEEIGKLAEGERNLFVFHSAFITKEKINSIGLKKYIKRNKEISNLVKQCVDNTKNPRLVIISSGASSLYDNQNLKNINYDLDPYGSLKFREEQLLSKSCDALILRIYALSGRFLRDPDVFAFGDFIKCAIEKKPIKISSANNVIRGYGFDGDISELAYNWLISKMKSPQKPIATVSDTISLRDLANTISDIYDLPSIHENIDKNLLENVYTHSSREYLEILGYFNKKPSNLRKQIISTYQGLLENFKK